MTSPYRALSHEALCDVIIRLPKEEPVPDAIQSEVSRRFNEARHDLMSGDSGTIMHSPGHARDLMMAVGALEYKERMVSTLVEAVRPILNQLIDEEYGEDGHTEEDDSSVGWRYDDNGGPNIPLPRTFGQIRDLNDAFFNVVITMDLPLGDMAKIS